MNSVIGNLEGIAVLAVVGFVGYNVVFGGGLLAGLSSAVFGDRGAMGGVADSLIGRDTVDHIGHLGLGGMLNEAIFGDGKVEANTATELKDFATKGDEKTLEKAKSYADKGDHETLVKSQVYADKGDVDTLTESKAYTDKAEREVFEKINQNTHSIESIDENLVNLQSVPLTETMFIDTNRYKQLMETHPGQRAKTVTSWDACHTGRGAALLGSKKLSTRSRVYDCLALQAYMDNGNEWGYSDEMSDKIGSISDQVAASGSRFSWQGVLSSEDIAQEHGNVRSALNQITNTFTNEGQTLSNLLSFTSGVSLTPTD